jgi:hypothetical protein
VVGSGILFSADFRPALGSTQPPIEWVPGALCPGGKAAGGWSWPLTSKYYRSQENMDLYRTSALLIDINIDNKNSVAWDSERTISIERQPFVSVVPAFADRGCRVVSVTDPRGRILRFLDRSRYFFSQVAPQLYSWGGVDPVPDPLLLRKSGSARNRTRDVWTCSQELWPLDHRGGPSDSSALLNSTCLWKYLFSYE